MIEANKNKLFPIIVSLVDDYTGVLVTGQSVAYDVREINDNELSPPISGTLSESTVEGGIYKTELSIPSAGSYICYATCSGFATSTEEIIINEENIYDIIKENRPHNLSVEDVVRTTASGSMTASQIARNVPYGRTDYIVTLIKRDSDLDWSSPTASGISYAHYVSTAEVLPFMMGGQY